MAKSLDEIILNRRTVRSFAPDRPTEGQIKLILKAGLHAPYAALAMPENEKLRRFIVVDGKSETVKRIKSIVRKRADKFAGLIPFLNVFLRKKISAVFRKRLRTDLMGEAPYYVFVVEPEGFPPAVKQSIAHCLQNMWLKATELGLGFRLVSIFEGMGKDREICRLLGIDTGRYAINCCAVGFPAQETEPSARPDLDEVTAWIRA
jgi:nitroreductase